MNISQAIDLLTSMYFLQQETGERFAIELVSGPGMGKDAAIAQAAARIGKQLGQPFGVKDFFLTTVEPPDVRGFGLPAKDSDGTPILQFTKAPWMPRAADPQHGFVFLNEFGQASMDVAKPAAELFLNGRVGESHLPIGYMVVAASNREQDRSGVGRGLAFIDNRKMRIEITPSVDSWVDWAIEHGIHEHAISYVQAFPGDIFADKVPDKPGPFCTPRTFVKCSYLIDKLPQHLMHESMAGYIGEGVAAKLITHLKMTTTLPKFQDIVAAPETTRVPDRPDERYAVMQMIAIRADAKTAAKTFKYLQRLGKDFSIAALKQILKRVPQVVQTPDFAVWMRENKDLVLAVAPNTLDKSAN